MSSVWITGLGAVTCLGGTAADLWRATLENRTGIAGGIGPVADRFVTPEFNDNRALAFAVRASGEAMAQAGWDELRPDDGLILATTTGLFLQWDRAFTEFVAGRMEREVFRRDFLHQPIGELTKFLARELGHRGPSTLLTSACSASTQALALGALWIRQGRARRCLVVGVEVLCDLTREGFRSLQLLSDERAKPFDRHRGGINLSEGAAALCLDTDGARALAGLAGSGLSTDAFHMTGPQPGGQGSERAMRQALRQAGIGARDVEWVHAHGTGSMAN
ncbi:MAG TPA: beta-ketoacyl synthase N-terminal-like domain-containing protein, partial [Bdellovibrionales bacterium]|nr:beta-ketoacyl synthase N-terminal-like domain-containing protein [Bdellovibrionales bacterium]